MILVMTMVGELKLTLSQIEDENSSLRLLVSNLEEENAALKKKTKREKLIFSYQIVQ